MSATTVLITGAGRGIGRGFAEAYLSRPNHTVIAAVRDPGSKLSQSLAAYPAAPGSSVLIVKIDNASETDPADAVSKIQAAGIDHLDIVIANAGIAGAFSRTEDMKLADLRQMIEINAYSLVTLYQAVYPLLKKTADTKGPGSPKFVGLSSTGSSLAEMETYAPFLMSSYGASKAVLNFFIRRAHFETEWLTSFALNPGFVQTDMGNAGAALFGMDAPPVTLNDCVNGCMKQIENATRDNISGKCASYDGSEMPF